MGRFGDTTIFYVADIINCIKNESNNFIIGHDEHAFYVIITLM